MGDFTGFTFGGYYSADLGITRVSGGDRYTDNLLPEIKDITAEVPGLNGEYYFGSTYSTRTFEIEFAFDFLTEKQFRTLKQVFGTRDIKQLIFDEYPYKYYLAKIENPIDLSFVCFDEPVKTLTTILGIGNEEHKVMRVTDQYQRIYKGEGKISFICYFPFAKSAFKQTSYQKTTDKSIDSEKTYYTFNFNSRQFDVVVNPNINDLSLYYVDSEEDNDWVISSGILSASNYANFDKYSNGIINIYNAGDVPTGFRLYCPFTSSTSIKISYQTETNGDIVADLNVGIMEPQKNGYRLIGQSEVEDTYDIGFLINTDNELIQGIKEFGVDSSGNAMYTTSGNIYNRYVESGQFFKLEPNQFYTDGAKLTISKIDNTAINNGIEIFYDYLYF